MTAIEIAYVYGDDDVHPVDTVERRADGRWRVSTRHSLVGSTFTDRDEAIEAVHAAFDGGAP